MAVEEGGALAGEEVPRTALRLCEGVEVGLWVQRLGCKVGRVKVCGRVDLVS